MSVVTATILSAGSAIDPTYELVSIDVSKEINHIPSAQLILIDGDVAQQSYVISNDAVFEPGQEIEIKLRYEGETEDVTVFKGLVVGHGVSANAHDSLLTVELKDAAVKSTLVRKNTIYREMTDDAILSQIIANNSLEEGSLVATTTEHLELVQYY